MIDEVGKDGAIVDEEATALSMHAYLALYRHTRQRRWLDRAADAAAVNAGWLYQWDIPAASGVPAAKLHLKPGVSTVGMGSTSSGNSFADPYVARNVDELLEVARLTKDRYFEDLARLALHGSKAMLALPGRTFDLAGPGWQQEGFYFGTPRGRGLNRSWLPWIGAAQLDGILSSEAADPAAFARIRR